MTATLLLLLLLAELVTLHEYYSFAIKLRYFDKFELTCKHRNT